MDAASFIDCCLAAHFPIPPHGTPIVSIKQAKTEERLGHCPSSRRHRAAMASGEPQSNTSWRIRRPIWPDQLEVSGGEGSATLYVRKQAPHIVLKQEPAGQPVVIELKEIR
jgi:hypothetical protein